MENAKGLTPNCAHHYYPNEDNKLECGYCGKYAHAVVSSDRYMVTGLHDGSVEVHCPDCHAPTPHAIRVALGLVKS